MSTAVPYMVLDIETFAEVRAERLDAEGAKAAAKAQAKLDELTRKGNDIKAPSTWKDPQKIKDHIDRERTKISGQIEKQTVNVAAEIEDAKQAFLSKAALSPMTGRVVSVGIGIRKVMGGAWEHAVFIDKHNQESVLLETVDRVVSRVGYASMITWNGVKFDLPFLVARSMRHGLKLKHKWPIGYSDRHIDLMDLLARKSGGFGGALKLWVREILNKERVTTGADVDALVREERWDELKAYNLEDIEDTAKLFDLLEQTAHLTRK